MESVGCNLSNSFTFILTFYTFFLVKIAVVRLWAILIVFVGEDTEIVSGDDKGLGV